MAKEFSYRQSFGADPIAVFTMLRDREYVQAKCEATGSLQTTVQVKDEPDGSATIVCTRVLPADVPAVARKFVGDTITATETQEWSPAASDGSRTAKVRVDFSGPLAFSGTLHLSAVSGGSQVTTEGAFTASVPFVGGTIESVAAEQTTRYLAAEEKLASTWQRD